MPSAFSKNSKKEEDKKNAPLAKSEDLSNQAGFGILIEPWVTEKSHQFSADNKYVFKVFAKANKPEIKKAIESLYKVEVKKINVVNIPAKKRYFGRQKGEKAGYKKCIVALKAGDKIELFKGV